MPLTAESGQALVARLVASWGVTKYVHMVRPAGRGVETGRLLFEALFSDPRKEKPVPLADVVIHFILSPGEGTDTDVIFQFEHDDLEFHVSVSADESLKPPLPYGYQPTEWVALIDRNIESKFNIREKTDLVQAFEASRLVAPAEGEAAEYEAVEYTDEEEYEDTEPPSINLLRESTASMQDRVTKTGDLLANIFDAADEDQVGCLMHREVDALLDATLKTSTFGLKAWDIKLLMKEAAEDDDGFISYQPFVRAAPELVDSLVQRRKKYAEKWSGYIQENPEAVDSNGDLNIVSFDACEVCYGAFVEETARLLYDKFLDMDQEGTGFVTRRQLQLALLARQERFSPQETVLLMQHLPQTEAGLIEYSAMFQHPTNQKVELTLLHRELLQLRVGAIHNALVETDTFMVWQHLVVLLRRHGLTPDNQDWRPFQFRDILLKAEQLCLPRVLVTVIMCQLEADFTGCVSARQFLEVCCRLIPSFFDAIPFLARVEQVQQELQAAQSAAEQAEIEKMTGGMMASLGSKNKKEDGEEEDDAPVDRETVEKNMIHMMQVMDDKHHGSLMPEAVTTAVNNCAESCKLSEPEVRGLIGEIMPEGEKMEVPFVEWVRCWVPIFFELRSSPSFAPFLGSLDDVVPAIPKPDMHELDRKFGMLPRTEAEEEALRRGEDISGRRSSVRMRRDQTGSKTSPLLQLSSKKSSKGVIRRSTMGAGQKPQSFASVGQNIMTGLSVLGKLDSRMKRPSKGMMLLLSEPRRQQCEQLSAGRRETRRLVELERLKKEAEERGEEWVEPPSPKSPTAKMLINAVASKTGVKDMVDSPGSPSKGGPFSKSKTTPVVTA